MDFHVQMRGYNLDTLETIVIEAAAKQIARGLGDDVPNRVQDEAIKLASKAIDDKLSPIVSDLFEQPILSRSYAKEETLTLREYIGLVGSQFLTTKVTRDGEPAGVYDRGEPRINQIISKVLEKRFKKEIEAEFAKLRDEVRDQIASKLDETIESERQRMADSIGYEITKRR
jgi:hypothetical protein